MLKQKTNHEARKCDPRAFTDRLIKNRPSIQNDLDSNWLITLSDVLSLLLVFFVVFTVMSSKVKAPTSKALMERPLTADLALEKQTINSLSQKNLVEEMSETIKKLRMENDVYVKAVNSGIIITMKEKASFLPGDADPLETSKPILNDIARVIKSHPEFQVEIEGHTDNVPINTERYPSNWELSVARATSVLKYFISQHGVDSSRLTIKGSADHKPLSNNDTPENRSINRRVEIHLKK